MSAPTALALIGFMGCGKSVIGQLVASQLAVPYHDLDAMIEAHSGRSINELFRRGEAEFRSLESELLPQALQPGAVVALGGGAPLDDGNWALIRARAVTVWLDAPIEVLLARAEPESRPLLRGRSDHALRSLWEVRMARYQEADYRVDATPPSPEVAAEVIKLWPG